MVNYRTHSVGIADGLVKCRPWICCPAASLTRLRPSRRPLLYAGLGTQPMRLAGLNKGPTRHGESDQRNPRATRHEDPGQGVFCRGRRGPGTEVVPENWTG